MRSTGAHRGWRASRSSRASSCGRSRWHPRYPILTLATAQAVLGRSKQAANEALALLAEKGVIEAVTVGKRNRVWEAKELFELVNQVERELATPDGEDEPTRPAPRKDPER